MTRSSSASASGRRSIFRHPGRRTRRRGAGTRVPRAGEARPGRGAAARAGGRRRQHRDRLRAHRAPLRRHLGEARLSPRPRGHAGHRRGNRGGRSRRRAPAGRTASRLRFRAKARCRRWCSRRSKRVRPTPAAGAGRWSPTARRASPATRFCSRSGRARELALLPRRLADRRATAPGRAKQALPVWFAGDCATADGTVTHAIGNGRRIASAALAGAGRRSLEGGATPSPRSQPLRWRPAQIRFSHFEVMPSHRDRQVAPSRAPGELRGKQPRAQRAGGCGALLLLRPLHAVRHLPALLSGRRHPAAPRRATGSTRTTARAAACASPNARAMRWRCTRRAPDARPAGPDCADRARRRAAEAPARGRSHVGNAAQRQSWCRPGGDPRRPRQPRRPRLRAPASIPITPSTECMEFLCLQEIEKGRVVRVESEHSAMGVCIGAAASRRPRVHGHVLQRPGLHG